MILKPEDLTFCSEVELAIPAWLAALMKIIFANGREWIYSLDRRLVLINNAEIDEV